MVFLGTSRWNSPELSNRLQLPAGRVFFADLPFNPASTEPASRKFTENFKKTFGSVPSSIEALVFDATELAELALRSAPQARSQELLEKLRAFKNHKGSAGKLTVEDNLFVRPLKVLTLADGRLLDAPETPKRPQAEPSTHP
jgi:ABC-type branched-subunit amino acid transport system substrate-binding protein